VRALCLRLASLFGGFSRAILLQLLAMVASGSTEVIAPALAVTASGRFGSQCSVIESTDGSAERGWTGRRVGIESEGEEDAVVAVVYQL